MKVHNKLVDVNNNAITTETLKKNATGETVKGVTVVYAHVDVVNDNGLKLNSDSIEVTREKYPVLIEHSDARVEDVVAYITTDGKPNEQGEFIGVIHFYNTEQGKHAAQLWADGVYNELSVSYYIRDYEIIDDLAGGEYINVTSALLKEVSIVSVGADRDTHEIKTEDEPANEPDTETEEPADENSTEQGEVETLEDTEEQNTTEQGEAEALEDTEEQNTTEEITENEYNKRTDAELNALKLEFFKNMV